MTMDPDISACADRLCVALRSAKLENEIRLELRALLSVLCAPGRDSPANCEGLGFFVASHVLGDPHVESSLNRLPRRLSDIIRDMGHGLHDTYAAPEIARAFRATPRLLLDRVLEEE